MLSVIQSTLKDPPPPQICPTRGFSPERLVMDEILYEVDNKYILL
jgi:hypothetical protein